MIVNTISKIHRLSPINSIPIPKFLESVEFHQEKYILSLESHISYLNNELMDLGLRYDKLADAYEQKVFEPDPNIWCDADVKDWEG